MTFNIFKKFGNTTLKFKSVQLKWFYGLAFFVLGLDQLSKNLVEQNLGPYGSGKAFTVGGGLIIRYSKNNGASGNILENTSWLLVFIAALAALAMLIFYHWTTPRSRLLQTGIGLLLGGTLGNLSDRIFKGGYVTDFIYLEWLPGAKNFNLADMAIRAGLAIIIIPIIFSRTLKYQNNKVKIYRKSE